MNKSHLITGATGHVGTVLLSKLLARNNKIRILALPDQQQWFPSGIEVVYGDITKEKTLVPFFNREGFDSVALIHCAALTTIETKDNPDIWNTNVNGTNNIMRLAFRTGVERVIYVSSVHAIPEQPADETIIEVDIFSSDTVYGQYAKSKAQATQMY